MATTLHLSDDDDTDYDQDMNSSNDNDNDIHQQEFESNIKKCRDALSQNPNDYTAHLNIVTALSNINYIHPFRKARDKMSRKFAIPPSVSINLINVEIEYLYYSSKDSTPSIPQINTVLQLYQHAINDYSVDIKLWTNYLQFVFQFETILGIQSIRQNVLNKAIRTIGQHFYDGHKFWSLYREFETQYLAILVNKQHKDDTPDLVDMDGMESDDDGNNVEGDQANYTVSKQTEKLRKIWKQQINIAHFQIEETYRQYQDWESALYGKTSSDYKSQYNASKKLSKYFKKWEHMLLQLEPNVSAGYASMERLNLWQRYISDIHEKIKNIKPKTLQSLYERCVLECFLHENIWKDYIEWIKECGLKFEIVSVCARSIRNIALSVHLWSEYIYAVQWTEMDIKEVQDRIFRRFVFPTGMIQDDKGSKVKKEEMVDFGNDMDKYIFIAIAKCEYYRMRAKCAFDEGYEDDCNDKENKGRMKEAECVFDEVSQLIDAHIGSAWSITFYKFYIDFISRFVGNIEKARNIWEKLIKIRGKEWNLWCGYIEWEMGFGETQAVIASKRKRSIKDDEDAEHRMKRFGHNNIYKIRHLYHRAIFILDIESGLEYIGEKLIEFERKCGDLESLKNAKIRIQKKLKQDRKRKQKSKEKRMKIHKRKLRRDNDNDNDTKYTKYVSNTIDAERITPHKKRKTTHNRTTYDDYNERRQKSDPNYIDTDIKGTKEERTVFVVNLRNTMSKKDVKTIFEKFGKLENIKLPNNKKEKHKHKLRGIGWIEYKHKDNATECIAQLNGTSVEGKILRVERYRNTANNDNTVYIKGLSTFTESEAQECIRSVLVNCGEIKEIRLTRETNNKIKGFGYVEFVKHESIEKAFKCDKSMYNKRIIDVLPHITEGERQKQNRQTEKQSKMDRNRYKSEHKMDVDHDDDVDKLGFVPRSISKRKSTLKENGNMNKTSTGTNQQFDQNILNKSDKSQDDFRKLFNI